MVEASPSLGRVDELAAHEAASHPSEEAPGVLDPAEGDRPGPAVRVAIASPVAPVLLLLDAAHLAVLLAGRPRSVWRAATSTDLRRLLRIAAGAEPRTLNGSHAAGEVTSRYRRKRHKWPQHPGRQAQAELAA